MTDQNKELIELINSKILSFSGIYVANSQLPTLITHIEKKAKLQNISPLNFCRNLTPQTTDFDEVINLVTVNETYFFREEKQFDFLREEIFPKYKGKNLTIWTCCCSTGEEPISILAIALSMNINLTIYASDIDDNALKTLERGCYSLYSLRSDGKKYHKLLEPYSIRSENEIIFNRDFLHRIVTFKFNLIQGDMTQLPFYENVDIIFMRNVFIYFDKETRILVTKKVTERLKSDGLLLFSMNEIGSIDDTVIPKHLYKTNSGVIYYFKKGSGKSKKIETLHAIQKEKEKELETQKKEKLRLEVKKAKQKRADDLAKALDIAAANVAAASKTESDFDIKRIYEEVCMEINRGDFTKARTIARALSGAAYKKYSFFMQGYIEYYADNRAAAETFFASAESLSPDFWPAFFYHGMVLRDLGRTERALGCFFKMQRINFRFWK